MRVKIGFSTHYNNLLSWVIRKVTKCPASHVWLLLEDSFLGQDMVLEASEVGYRLVSLSTFKKKNDIVYIRTPKYDISEGVRNQVNDLGQAYDFPGLFGAFFPVFGRYLKVKWKNPFNTSKAMFCSESIVQAMLSCGYPGSEKFIPSSTSPADLLSFFDSESH